MELEQLGLNEEPRLTGTGAADDQHVFVPGRLGVFGTPGHGKPFRLGQQDIVFKLGVDVGRNILGLLATT